MFRGISILIVEDSKIFRGIYEIYLSELGCELSFAVNGWEALEYLKHREPNIILLDMDMPEMDGPTAFKMLRKQAATTVFIICVLCAMPMISNHAHIACHYDRPTFSKLLAR